MMLAVALDLLAPAALRSSVVYTIPLLVAWRFASSRTTLLLVAVAVGVTFLNVLLGRSSPSSSGLSMIVLAGAGAFASLRGNPRARFVSGVPKRSDEPAQTFALADNRASTRVCAASEQLNLDLLQSVVEQLSAGVIVAAVPSGRILFRNSAFRQLTGAPSEPERGGAMGTGASPGPAADPDVPSSVAWLLQRAALTGDVVRDEEVTVQRGDGREAVLLVSATPVFDSAGEAVATVATLVDVTEHKRAEEARAFLAQASALLASSLDLESTLAHLTRLLVSGMADWCLVEVRGGEWTTTQVAVAHRDAMIDQSLRSMMQRLSSGPGRHLSTTRSQGIRTAEHLSNLSCDDLLGTPETPEDRQLVNQLGIGSAVAVPLVTGGDLIGTIFLARSHGEYTAEDLALAEEVGRRAGQAVDNARRYDIVQRTGEMRRRFLTVASHELRTPVTSLLGYAQVELRRVSRRGSLDPERVVTTLQAIERQARNLALLISRLLDLTMIDGGQVTLDIDDVDVTALLTKVVSRVRRQTSRHILLMDAPERLLVRIDPFWIEKVLLNLLDNAIRYSPEGGPIEVAAESQPDGVILTVRDYGIGIPHDQLTRIFDRYVGAHEDSHRSGIGLGLSICRQIVEMHGGEISAEAPETGGTRLLVTLPTNGPTRRICGGS